MRVTIKQIAEKAGVSRGTVDRVLNHRGKVRPEVEERVQKIADELGYRPNLLGRALGMSKNNIKIGVVVQACETAFIKEALKGILGAAQEVENFGGDVIVKRIPDLDPGKVLQSLEELKEEEVKAIALMPVDDQRIRDKMNQLIREDEIPILTFNADIEGTERFCFVGQNAYRCGETAAALMGAIFHQKGGEIAVISGYESNTSLSRRVKGFRRIISEEFSQIRLLDTEYCGEQEEKAEQITRDILKKNPDLSGIYITCFGENGVCRALKDTKKDRDIIMVASDMMGQNYELLRDGVIDLLIGQLAVEQGYEAVMTLYRLLFNGEKPEQEFRYMDIVIKNKYNID